MRYTYALLILLVLAPVAQPAQKEKKAASTQVVTACLDEKADYYVLRADDMLKEVAVLELRLVSRNRIFARYVGHKVSITGELNSSTQPPTLRVTSPAHIKDISDMCVPEK